MNKNQKDLRLLPTHFKKVAFGIMVSSVLFLFLFLSKTLIFDKEIAMTISKTGILISLLILALTKNKIEDELTIRIRLIAFTGSFIGGVVWVIVEPFRELLLHDSFSSDEGATGILILMFLIYFMTFYLMLNKR
ncbi:MAG: hypothetical protein HQ521_13100 [Bacteroidetes bacterium]|nr:hypothetical protein [Bacteroidota bacterium]